MAKALRIRRIACSILPLCLVGAGVSCFPHAVAAQETRVVIDGRGTGRIFDGLGAASAGASSRLLIDYPEPARSRILDYLFKPGYGASLQRLKVEVGADVNSTDGAEPSLMRSPQDHDAARGYEWWLMAEAHERNPKIVLEILPWGAPAWAGSPIRVGAEAGGRRTLYTAKMAAYMAEFIQAAKRAYGLDIAYAGVWNERVYDADYVKELHRRLAAAHLATKIVCCDEYPGEGNKASGGQWAIAEDMQQDAELARDVAAIGVHYPLVDGHLHTTDAARNSGKPLWSSEDQPNGGSGPFVSRDWAEGGRILAHRYNQNYLEGALTATEIWSPITSYYDNLAAPNSGLMYANTPWSGHYQVQGAIWATAHTTQFAQPGWQYLDASSGELPERGSYVSLRAPDRRNWSVILETIGSTRAQSVSFQIAGGLDSATVHVWETNATHTFEHVGDVTPRGGAFTYTFDPDSLYSLTTTTGQGKGTAEPPPAAPFPLPYGDNFESTPIGRAPKYLADQDGAFEVRRCAGRAGRCLEQAITEIPVPWGPEPDPFTLAGDAAWTDYSVAADVHFLSGAPAVLMGRIDSSDVFKDGRARWPSGYVLRVKPDGDWELLSAAYGKPPVTLASGTVKIDSGQWHHLELRFKGRRMEALLDGSMLGSAEDGSHARGMFALGTEWNRIQFDNLRISPN